MTAVTETASGPGYDPAELRANLMLADAGVLLCVLAQLTGDAGVLERFGRKIEFVADPPEQVGVTDPETLAALAEDADAAVDGHLLRSR